MSPSEPENGSLLWCSRCRLAFFALGTRARVLERARACGWIKKGDRDVCDECRPDHYSWARRYQPREDASR